MIADAIAFVKRRYAGTGARSGPNAGAREGAAAEVGSRSVEAAAGTGEDASVPGSDDADLHPLAMTPSEEVLALLGGNGGRIGQGDVVDAFDWSPATVSRRLGEMEAAGDVVRYQVGRRKVVCLPDACPDAARSPFEA